MKKLLLIAILFVSSAAYPQTMDRTAYITGCVEGASYMAAALYKRPVDSRNVKMIVQGCEIMYKRRTEPKKSIEDRIGEHLEDKNLKVW